MKLYERLVLAWWTRIATDMSTTQKGQLLIIYKKIIYDGLRQKKKIKIVQILLYCTKFGEGSKFEKCYPFRELLKKL